MAITPSAMMAVTNEYPFEVYTRSTLTCSLRRSLTNHLSSHSVLTDNYGHGTIARLDDRRVSRSTVFRIVVLILSCAIETKLMVYSDRPE